MSREVVRVGIDDTDSKRTMCTTYVGCRALRALELLGCVRVGDPVLVRLNPNCPYKTRGNAAVGFSVKLGRITVESAIGVVSEVVRELADLDDEGTDPGIVFMPYGVMERLRDFYLRTLRELVDIDEAMRLCDEYALAYKYFKEGRGLIGALSATSVDESHLLTYELLAYRERGNWGRPRRVSPDSVIRMDQSTRPYTFDNYDYEKRSVRLTPHTPCPVLVGIRGTSREVLKGALQMIEIDERVDFWEIFATNQATDIHYVESRVSEVRHGVSASVRGVVVGKPYVERGGHVFAKITDYTGHLTLAAYEPTLSFRRVVCSLLPGDEVVAFGAIKHKPQGITMNLEKLLILRLAEIVTVRPPICGTCGKRGESAGFGKGYRCRRCGIRLGGTPEIEVIERDLRPGMYEVAVSARRHLVRPLGLALASHD
ncbi:MAG: tRNA(Ile)(2)-agmatinylcytidine synthase [Aigarchaeota archaeon]|nr:tRNA(Ile)(2)-agmatinylcytidine synthase [Aigarchaeota archaeon]MDW8092303.1 tRNA(Ile)(2)-agmatinylcytidine synthase [Nitrososphaerota archaeon]